MTPSQWERERERPMQTDDGLSPIVHAAKSEEEQLVMEMASENIPARRQGGRETAGTLFQIWRQNHHRKTELLAQKKIVRTIRLANQRKRRLNSRNVEMMEKLCGQ